MVSARRVEDLKLCRMWTRSGPVKLADFIRKPGETDCTVWLSVAGKLECERPLRLLYLLFLQYLYYSTSIPRFSLLFIEMDNKTPKSSTKVI